MHAFHAYAGWLVGISWRRFFVLAILLLAVVGILHDMPPLTWRVREQVQEPPARVIVLPQPPKAPAPPGADGSPPSPPARRGDGVDISIGKDGIRIVTKPAADAASAASQAAEKASGAAAAAASAASAVEGIVIRLPSGAVDNAVVREAVAEAQRELEQAIREAKDEAEQAARDAEEARRDAEQAIADLKRGGKPRITTRTTRIGIGDFLMQFTVLWVLASALLKIVYKGRIQAEAQAARATETAESEALKRQVVEARMAAMQAQVEPHFLFNTLASIDHLIEVDPARASLMQKNLIALLRASMPSMRDVSPGSGGLRDLGRELAVIRPYLEILKVRMEERLATEIRVSDGLLSAEFPPMMLQSLVENAIKHGLEPKAEGGRLTVAAEIVHGKLAVTVADTGLGFGKAATAGTGIGLSNIRERLQLLYGAKASLKVAENPGGGTAVTITVPYQSNSVDAEAAA
ncbi:histidine kinase [Piscinibacter sakaiensis]|uniref:histidine kinase n=1 Tax=Piscinibacter sakaiensis TaxID=1547922 RepID=UPI0006B4AF93